MYDDDYDQITARYYDAAYEALPGVGRDADFYLALARETGGPVLEIGCGTGRVLARVAAEGLDCTGLDASAAMLEVLRAREPRVRCVQADMRSFDLGDQRFALIFSAFRPFLMARAGFEDVRIHGDFDRSPVGPDSPAYVVVAR